MTDEGSPGPPALTAFVLAPLDRELERMTAGQAGGLAFAEARGRLRHRLAAQVLVEGRLLSSAADPLESAGGPADKWPEEWLG